MQAVPQTEAEAKEFYKKQFGEGAWRWVAFLAIYFCTAMSGLYIPKWLNVPISSPGANPPWYFIRQDFFTGVGSLIGALVVLGILGLTRHRYPATNSMLKMFVAIWMLPSIVTATIIFVRCQNFFDFNNAVSSWPTFNDYFKSSAKYAGIPVAFVVTFVLLIPEIRKFRARRAQSRI